MQALKERHKGKDMNAKWWKLATALLGCCCLLLMYRVFDMGISRTYADASMKDTARHGELLASIIEHEWAGMTEDQLMPKLQAYVKSHPDDEIFIAKDAEEHAVYLGDVSFDFKDGKLSKVR
jgi:hypothetical protein